MSEWISSQDRLPDDNNPVLAIGYKNGVKRPTTAMFIPTYGWTNYWTRKTMSVTYWMPLPKMPGED